MAERTRPSHLTAQRIVVTGAAGGIGRALVAALREAVPDARIAAADRDAAALEHAWAEDRHIIPITADVSTPEGNDALFAAADAALGGIDLFIANAGFAYYERYDKADWARLEAICRVNVLAPLYALARMRERARPGQPYTVVFTASAMAHVGVPGYAVYAGTKAALDRFAEAYRYERAPGERLMLVYPIGTRTGFFARAADRPAPSDVPLMPTQSPEEVAAAVVRGLQRGAHAVYPSRTFRFLLAVRGIVPVLRLAQMSSARAFAAWQRGASS
jgi:short-subunit dehydrogenase